MELTPEQIKALDALHGIGETAPEEPPLSSEQIQALDALHGIGEPVPQKQKSENPLVNARNYVAETVSLQLDNQQSIPETLLQAGAAGVGLVGNVIGTGVIALTPKPVKQGAVKAYQALPEGVKSTIGSGINAVKELDQSLSEQYPRAMRNLKAGATIAAAAPAPISGAASKAMGFAGDVAQSAKYAMKAAESPMLYPTRRAMKVATKDMGYNPLDIMKATASTYDDATKTSGKLFEVRDAAAIGKPVDASSLSDDISRLIADIESDPTRSAVSSLPKFKAWKDKIDSSLLDKSNSLYIYTPKAGKFDLADAAQIKQELNSFYKGGQWNQKGAGSAYADLGGKVGSILDDAAVKYPDFGQAQDIANKYWLNNVNNTFRDNSIMNKFFTADDMNEFKTFADGRTTSLHPETVNRALKIVSNIKTGEELNALRKVLPPKLAGQLTKATVKSLPSGNRLQALGRIITGGGISRAQAVGEFIAGAQRTPLQKSIIAAAKAPKPEMATIEQLKALKPKDLKQVLGAMPPRQAMETMKQLKKVK